MFLEKERKQPLCADDDLVSSCLEITDIDETTQHRQTTCGFLHASCENTPSNI